MPSRDPELVSALASLGLSSDHKIIVGVDYGTTFTGVSFSSSRGKGLDDIKVIEIWPGASRDSTTVVKAPSRIAYPEDNQCINSMRWGYQITPGTIAFSWTKLLLDQNTPLTKYDDPTLETASEMGILKLPEGKTAIDLVKDYLTGVYQHITLQISKQITEDTLKITPLEFWFTVPAIWSDQARSATITAARQAGFGDNSTRPHDTISLISEPEAAAIAALKKYTNGFGASVKVGDGVLICDCGGGTVDITTYLVTQVLPTLSFEELCTGTGGKCGSTAIDRNFYQLMSDRFGEAFDNLPAKRKSPGSEFMSRFETVKSDFGLDDEPDFFELPLNMNAPDADPKYFDNEERMVLLSRGDLRSIFYPVVKQILGLVNQQIKDAQEAGSRISRIILVGGFGNSEYLRQAFRSSFEPMHITITVPDKPQAAIVQGAVLRGLMGLRSTTKRCRRHYGFTWGKPFREGIDDGYGFYIHDFTGEKMVAGIMKWMIARGQKYSENHTSSVSIVRSHSEDYLLKRTDKLFASDSAVAAERDSSSSVYLVGNITVDFSNTDLERFESKMIRGKKVYLLQYELKVIFGAQEGILKFEATSQGKTIGQTSIRYNTVKHY